MTKVSSLWNLLIIGALVFLLIFTSIHQKLHARTNIVWQKLIGKISRDIAYGIAVLNNKTIAVAGWTGSKSNPDDQNVFLIRLDKNGKTLWQREMNGEGTDGATCVKATSDGGFIVIAISNSKSGDFPSINGLQDVWVLKFDELNNLVWKRCYGTGSYEAVFDIIEDDGYVLVGYTLSQQTAEDIWVFKISKDGDLLWSTVFGGIDWDTGFSVTKWNEGYIVAGLIRSQNPSNVVTFGSADMLLAYISKNGQVLWQKAFGGSDWDQPSHVFSTTDGGFVLLGTSWSEQIVGFNRAGDIVMIKFDKEGKQEFVKTFGGSADDIARKGMEVDEGYVIAGTTWSNDGNVSQKHGGSDYWLIKLDRFGNLFSEESFGDHQDEILYGLEKIDGEYLLVGVSYSYMIGLSVRSHGGGDIYLVKTK